MGKMTSETYCIYDISISSLGRFKPLISGSAVYLAGLGIVLWGVGWIPR